MEKTMEINKQDTAVVITDPQNDFLSEKGVPTLHQSRPEQLLYRIHTMDILSARF